MFENLFLNLPKSVKETGGICKIKKGGYALLNTSDSRVERQIKKHLPTFYKNDEPVLKIDYANNSCEDLSFNQNQGYKITLSENEISVFGKSAQGAFYGIITLSQLFEVADEISCMEITDQPDMLHRGFYFDVSRGRISKVNSVKRLIDYLAKTKTNSLQLYIEHTFEFEGFEEINRKYGYYTAQELKEIDDYCHENFIDCIPSLSTFGHMYIILQNRKFNHLCELENFNPELHIWSDRMNHHTIDGCNPESIRFVCSMIDQLSSCFHSNYFNICGDETFDLCKGKNKGKDAGTVYVEYINRLIAHLTGKGKTPMMWGDVILNHADKIKFLSKDVIMLNWNYAEYVDDTSTMIFAENGFKQLVCPGVQGWLRFSECLEIGEGNIHCMVENGYKHNALGMLNTCWGDYGHTADIENTMFGMAYGASKAWNVTGFNKDAFCKNCSKIIFGSDVDLEPFIKAIEPPVYIWGAMNSLNHTRESKKQWHDRFIHNGCNNFMSEIQSAICKLEKIDFNDQSKERIILSAKINLAMCEFIKNYTHNGDFESACEQLMNLYARFREIWQEDNKKDELFILDEFFNTLLQRLTQ